MKNKKFSKKQREVFGYIVDLVRRDPNYKLYECEEHHILGQIITGDTTCSICKKPTKEVDPYDESMITKYL